MEYLLLIVSAILVNNFVLSRFLGICPFLGVSKNISTALGNMNGYGGEVDAITAATISSRAVLECIRDAIGKYEKAAAALATGNQEQEK